MLRFPSIPLPVTPLAAAAMRAFDACRWVAGNALAAVALACAALGVASSAAAVSLSMSTDKSTYDVGEPIVVTLTGDTAGGAPELVVWAEVAYSDPTLVNGAAAIAWQSSITSFGGFVPWTTANPSCSFHWCLVLNQLAGVQPLPPDPAIIIGTLTIPTIAQGTLTISILSASWFGAPAPPPVEVTIVAGGGGAPALSATKSDAQSTDDDMDGTVDGGDRIRYTVVLTNEGEADAQNVVFSDTPDANTPLVDGSVTTSQGIVMQGNGAGDATLEVDIGTIPPGDDATVTFDVEVVDPLPDGVQSVSNQGSASATGVGAVPTDDPDTGAPDDATVTDVESAFESCQEDRAACDSDLGVCESDLGTCSSDLGSCQADLSGCQNDPPFEDADGDGEHDDTDACPGTPAGAVDQAGCSLAQFCAGCDVSGTNRNSPCNQADWANDEPLGAEDCKARGGVCEPR